LLDRGNPHGREFALRLGLMARTPELLAALRDFGLGQRGPDQMRLEAAQAAADGGVMEAGPIRFWARGQWTEVLLLSFEVDDEHERKHSPQVEEWAVEALEALHEEDGARAEQLLQQALAVEPDSPDFLNNLASAYELQGRSRESEDLVRQIHQRFP